ncbi:Phospho-N-acetylmuramoyl-pentapeptide- transferase [sediment metagenome]|uniref:Phospho-N-acetylmuramoyl-pentapeptide-transferase n=1 Tax=sediment metagenome TaxID=749907 RepID=D9PIE5_9ZZZZ
MVIYFIFGDPMIKYLAKKQLWQTVRNDGPVTHMDKRGTPTMGGILLWIAVLGSTLLWTRFDQLFVVIGLALAFCFAAIGFLDDYRKVILRDAKGLRARHKFPLQVAFAVMAVLVLFDGIGLSKHLSVPFFKTVYPDIGLWYYFFAVIVIVGASNAVNLTDGLDGLVSVPSIVAFFAFGVLAYIAGHVRIASYLVIPSVPGSGELTVLCGAVVGACIGFLWFNAHPASVFMGDVGSLPLGAVLGYVSVVTKNEILLLFIGGIFVLETISVITQVVSFKLTGKRIFKMAPLHHHFELKGWPESKVIVRFWIIAFILAIVSLTTLKLR